MSDNVRIPRERALRAAEWIQTELGMSRCLLAGSLRRKLANVGDIELLVPMPWGTEADSLLEALQARVNLRNPLPAPKPAEPDLFALGAPAAVQVAAPPRTRYMTEIKGIKPGFRYCQLRAKLAGEPKAHVFIDIWRYDPGPDGNRGWIELIRTGPADFGKNACIRWNQLTGGNSKEGYLRNPDGSPVACPTEERVFELLQWKWVPPERR